MLQQKQMLEDATWSHPGLKQFLHDEGIDSADDERDIDADTVDLVRVFQDILDRLRDRPIHSIDEDSVTVAQMIDFVKRRLLMEDHPISLRKLLQNTKSERALICTFLAMLELVRLQAILLRQAEQLGDILIKKTDNFEQVLAEQAQIRDDWAKPQPHLRYSKSSDHSSRSTPCAPTYVSCTRINLTALVVSLPVPNPDKPWPIRAVIITTFEIGNDTGDIPGEFQFWVEREHLDRDPRLPRRRDTPAAHPLRTNKDHTVLGIVSGTTLVNATASMMALGLDPRFDLTHAYILINGIAGVDPNIASIGSAAWADYVVNDVAREIDPREAPRLALRLLPHRRPRPEPATVTEPPGPAPTSTPSTRNSPPGPTRRPKTSPSATTPPSPPSAPASPTTPMRSSRPSSCSATPSPATTTGTARS